MKRTTYLVYKPQSDGTTLLDVATIEEWNAILKRNQGLPVQQRRCFILDAIEDSSDIDLMYVEVTPEEYRKWHSGRVISERNRKNKKKHKHISLNTTVTAEGTEELLNVIPSDYRLDEIVHDRVLMEELRNALCSWMPWANDILDVYLSGRQRHATTLLAKKYAVSEQTIRSYKRRFESFVIAFLSELYSSSRRLESLQPPCIIPFSIL